jgi:hypothetical protein
MAEGVARPLAERQRCMAGRLPPYGLIPLVPQLRVAPNRIEVSRIGENDGFQPGRTVNVQVHPAVPEALVIL